MKKIALTIGSLLLASTAFAKTTVHCTGRNTQLTTSFSAEDSAFKTTALNGKSTEFKTTVELGTVGAMEQLSQKMTVKLTVWPAGTLKTKEEVRSYEGFYVTPKLKTGFAVSQSVDASGTVVSEIKNVFGLNGKQVGTCTVTESEESDDLRANPDFVATCPEQYLTYFDKSEGGPGAYCQCPEEKVSYSDKADGGPGFYCAE